ncbi:hypothetical protein [Paraliomyxa miuraensis]|uniref:hypothetical protein n=1 Tax=Paraliomyxa miuraensis TaxID=376150 RepID=UPI002258AA76|nr:hypothetical protein [Paraliomyxa miuraensis]MCX4242971.1 hypothetical protein [Paraliomyxa miuraensis]
MRRVHGRKPRLGVASSVAVTLVLAACERDAPPVETSTHPAPAASPPSSPVPPAGDDVAAPPRAASIQAFLTAEGPATFVRGTAGDAVADRAIAAQIDLARTLLADATVVDDTSIDLAAGPSAWPARPIVYGGPHVNSLLAVLPLPFVLSPGELVIGDHAFTGDQHRVIALVPATTRHPEFLLYAGTGTPGIAEINALPLGSEQVLVADAFGRRVEGRWEGRGDALAVRFGAQARRIAWRTVDRELTGADATTPADVHFRFPDGLPAAADEADLVAACMRGLETVVAKLGITAPASVTVYVYPDRRSKESLTGNGGDGHAVPSSHTLHVLAGPGLESLVAHEGTHVLGPDAWGPAPTPMLAEGLAVWVAGGYAGRTLEELRPEIAGTGRSPIVVLLEPRAFRSIAEGVGYPLAGLLVDALVTELGASTFTTHLLGATADRWDEACRAAGTSAGAIEDALARRLAR